MKPTAAESGVKEDPRAYWTIEYDSKERFVSYWHQIREVVNLGHQRILEVGIGNAFVSTYLVARGFDLVTFDIDLRLSPRVVGSVLALPFDDGAFDVTMCCEVLEHLPFECLPEALTEIRRVSRSAVVLSLPDAGRAYRILLRIPRVGDVCRLIELPKLWKPVHQHMGEHYWEIGKAGYPLQTVDRLIKAAGLSVERTYRVFENPYHRFFVLGAGGPDSEQGRLASPRSSRVSRPRVNR